MKKNIKSISGSGMMTVMGLVLLFFLSCGKDVTYNQPVSGDHAKPGVVTGVKVTNFHGGAYITYTLPNSNNLLYVEAQYNINDKTSRQTKSSYYTDTIMVSGFAKSQDYEVTLHTVSRSNVQSDAVKVTVHPDVPYYELIKPTITLNADFGGVNIQALNTYKQPVGLILLAVDPLTNKFAIKDQHYANIDSINYSIRGYDATPKKFGVYVTDEFGNVSDTSIVTVTPLPESILDKSKFFAYNLNSDSQIGFGWLLPYLWDGKTDGNSPGWHTNPGQSLPAVCSFGIGPLAKLSRFIMWERPNEFSYTAGNPRDFTIWGSAKDAPADVQLPLSSVPGTVVGDWINMGNFHYPDPPSGLPPGSVNDADKAFVAAGVNFNVPLSSPAVKFIRLAVATDWSNGDYAHVMEISFYGQTK